MQAKIDELWIKTYVADSFIRHFVRTYCTCTTPKLKSYKQALPNEQLLYYRRDLFSGLELYARYDRQLMNPNRYRNLFLSIEWLLYYRIQLFSVLELDARYNWWLWLQTLIAVLSDKPFVRGYMHTVKTTGYIWTFSISNDCSTIRHIPCVV